MDHCFDALGLSDNACEAEVRKAYRALARRWHPDRFADGPERMWAEQKMVTINIAYHEALIHCAGHMDEGQNELTPHDAQLEDVRALLEIGQLSAARQALMRVSTRNAEWNYLFGAVLLRLGEYEKAVLYFGIAMRQRPGNAQYRTAYLSADMIRNQKNRRRPFSDWWAKARGSAL